MVRQLPHRATVSLPAQTESGAGVVEQVIHYDPREVRCKVEPLGPGPVFDDTGAEIYRPHRMMVGLSVGEQIARLNGLVVWSGLRLRVRSWQHFRGRATTAHTTLMLESERRQPVVGDR